MRPAAKRGKGKPQGKFSWDGEGLESQEGPRAGRSGAEVMGSREDRQDQQQCNSQSPTLRAHIHDKRTFTHLKGKIRERSFIHWFTTQMVATVLGLGQAKVRSLELQLDLPQRWQGSRAIFHCFPGALTGAGSKEEQLDFPVLIRDAGNAFTAPLCEIHFSPYY